MARSSCFGPADAAGRPLIRKLGTLDVDLVPNAADLNNSDIDFCDWQRRLVITYSWGNQLGVEQLAEAVYDGTEAQFLEGWFPPTLMLQRTVPSTLPRPATPRAVSSRSFSLAMAILLVATQTFPATPGAAPKRPSSSKQPKTWTTFENCHYLDNPSNDADSFQVRCGKKTIHVRLYFVDAPESNLSDPERVQEQSQHFGLSTDETIRAGKLATEITRQTLSKPFTVHTRWTVAGGRSRQPRYYSIVETGQRDLAELLVEHGCARTKGAVAPTPGGEPSKSVVARLQRLESEARQRRIGAWGLSIPVPAPDKSATPQVSPQRR